MLLYIFYYSSQSVHFLLSLYLHNSKINMSKIGNVSKHLNQISGREWMDGYFVSKIQTISNMTAIKQPGQQEKKMLV